MKASTFSTMHAASDLGALGVHPRPLGYLDVPKAVLTGDAAFKNDPHRRYTFETPDAQTRPWRRITMKILIFMVNIRLISEAIHRGTAWTVNHGDAMMIYSMPASSIAKSRLSKFIDILFHIIDTLLKAMFRIIASPEQKYRVHEGDEKTQRAVKLALGDRVEDMFQVQLVATAPDKQGYGYGSSLVQVVTSKADEECRSTWLTSSNFANTRFYESLGFASVGEISLGHDNPTWNGPPVIVLVMVREPATYSDEKC